MWLPAVSIYSGGRARSHLDRAHGFSGDISRQDGHLGRVIAKRKQDGQRLWLHVRNRPLDKEYRPHRPTVNEGPECGYYWVMVPDTARLPPKWNQWARVTVVGRVSDPKQAESPIGPSMEPILTLLFLQGWTMGQAQQGGTWEESVDANYLLSVPDGLHGE